MLQLTFPNNIMMQKTYKVEGEFNNNTFSVLSIKLGCIQSQRLGDKLAIIMVFDVRHDIEDIFAEHGLKILEFTENI